MFYEKVTTKDEYGEKSEMRIKWVNLVVTVLILIPVLAYGFGFFGKIYGRYQKVQDAKNEIAVNEMKIKQTEQLVKVEQQKADIRVVEAQGISKAQEIINITLTDRYLQHEAIKAQEEMANSQNHTTIYIPSGQNGIPIVNTIDPNK